MNIDPTGEVRLNSWKTGPWLTPHPIFERRSCRSSQDEAPLSRRRFPHDVIGPILTADPASNGECRLDAFVRVGNHQLDAIKGQEAFDPIAEGGAVRRPRGAARAGRAGAGTRSRRSRPPLQGLLALLLSGTGSDNATCCL